MAVVIETGFTGITYDLTHLRIGWRRITGTATASSAAAGFAASNANTVRTDSAWRSDSLPGSAATWTLTFDADADVSYVGIAGHDLGTQNATVEIEVSDGLGGWDAVAGSSVSPVNDDVILWLFDTVNTDAIRLTISVADDDPTIAVVSAGAVTEWPRRAVWTGTPITESDTVTFVNNLSDTGNWLGRTRTQTGQEFSVQVNNLPETWRVGELPDFKAHANGEDATFFIALRPGDDPNELAYAWSTDTVMATRDRNNRPISGSITLKCMGHKPA